MDGVTIVRIIESELSRRGISKEQFYSDCGISSATLSQWRTGKYFPSVAKLQVIQQYLGISFSEYDEIDQREGLREDLKILLKSAADLPPSSVYDLIAEIHRRKEMGKVDSSS